MIRWLPVLALLMVPAVPVWSQRSPGPESSVLVGPSRYELTKTGTGFAGKLTVAFRPTRILIIEPTLGYLTYRNDFGQRTHWFFPELSFQAEARLGRWRPYAGIGGGAGVASLVGREHWEGTLHATGGLRLRLGRNWGGRAEIRWRAVPPWSGHAIDFGFGLARGMF